MLKDIIKTITKSYTDMYNEAVIKAKSDKIDYLERKLAKAKETIEEYKETIKIQQDNIKLLEENVKNSQNIINQQTETIKLKLNELKQRAGRQSRIYQNKVNHGFNLTNVHQEVRYILEEVAELMHAIEKNDRANMKEELADIVIFAYGCASVANLGNLDTEIDRKMEINEQRVYKKKADGDFQKVDNQ